MRIQITGAVFAFGALGLIVANPAAAATCVVATSSVTQTADGKAGIQQIKDKVTELGAALGAADTEMCEAPDKRGKFRHYANGSVYWSPESGAHAVFGLIRQRWGALNWEQGYLGYPLTDEINTYDGAAKVTKFQGGQLVWRPWNNKVSEHKATDLKVDLPIPAGEEWRVGQANATSPGNSHGGSWAYCYDLNRNVGTTDGVATHAAATAKLVTVHDTAVDSDNTNIIIQDFGVGRYASYLHLKQGKHANAGNVTAAMPWADRPTVKNGAKISEVGTWMIPQASGDPIDNSHVHFCVTTAPDVKAWGTFESTPFVFRNYEKKVGNTWVAVAEGRPVRGDVLRRKITTANDGAPTIYGFSGIGLLNYGTLSGTVDFGGNQLDWTKKIAVEVVSPWGQPIVASYITVPQGKNGGPISYKLNVPTYQGMTVRARYVHDSIKLASPAVKFNVTPNKDTVQNLKLAPN